MPSMMSAPVGARSKLLRVQLRSVIPGRQRWDVTAVLNRPRVAEFLEAELRESPGVAVARANPVTGRVLVCHDTTLSREDIGRRVHAAVALAFRRPPAAARAGQPTLLVPPRPAGNRQRTGLAFAVAGGAAVALVLGNPLVRLGAVVAATAVVLSRAWRRSRDAAQKSTGAAGAVRRPLLHIVRSHRRKFYLASCLSAAAKILTLAILLPVGWIAQVLLAGESATLAGLGLASVSSQLWFLAGMTALVSLAAAAASFAAGKLWQGLAQSVQHEWRTEIYAHVQWARLQYLEDERATRLARVLTEDINQLGRFFATSADYLIQLGTGPLIIVPLFLFLAPGIAWIVLLPIPIVAWLSFSHQEHAAPDYQTASDHDSRLSSQLINNLEASTTVKSFSTEAYEIDRIHQLSQAYQHSSTRTSIRALAYAETVRSCTLVSMAGILLIGSRDVLAGTLPFSTYSALAFLPQFLLWRLPELGGAVDQYHRTVTALGRVLELRDLPVESADAGRRLPVKQVEGGVVFDGVSFAYPGRPPVLHKLSMRIAPKQTTGIVGLTGAGKTTLAKLLLRFYDVSAGQILLDGRDIRELRLHDLRTAIGFVSQDTFLFDATVADNIRYGSFNADPAQLENATRLAQAEDFVQALPAQYDTMIGERGTILSGGQKQRLALARAITKNAPLVILDEATSAVDNETEAAIRRSLAEFVRDRTLVIIAHRLSTIRHADWIYVLNNSGGIAEAGTHDELLHRNGVYASLWRLQISEVRG